MTRRLAALLAVAGFLAGLAVCWAVHAAQQPHCPTEDSCTINYRDGRWHIEESTP